MKERFEVSSIDSKIKKKIQKWCIDHKKTHGEFMEIAFKSLIHKA